MDNPNNPTNLNNLNKLNNPDSPINQDNTSFHTNNNIKDNSLIINKVKLLNPKSKEITYVNNPDYINIKTKGLSSLKNKLNNSCK